jgi:hypothetical protein
MSRDIEDLDTNMSDNNKVRDTQSYSSFEPPSPMELRDPNKSVIPWTEFAVDFHSSSPSFEEVE